MSVAVSATILELAVTRDAQRLLNSPIAARDAFPVRPVLGGTAPLARSGEAAPRGSHRVCTILLTCFLGLVWAFGCLGHLSMLCL